MKFHVPNPTNHYCQKYVNPSSFSYSYQSLPPQNKFFHHTVVSPSASYESDMISCIQLDAWFGGQPMISHMLEGLTWVVESVSKLLSSWKRFLHFL
jgi:hypothetical protein